MPEGAPKGQRSTISCPRGARREGGPFGARYICPELSDKEAFLFLVCPYSAKPNRAPEGKIKRRSEERLLAQYIPSGQPFGHILRSPKGRAHTAPLGAAP